MLEKEHPFDSPIRGLDETFLRKNDKKLHESVLSSIEKPLIEKILERTRGNQLKAAGILGINRNTLHAKIKKLGIEVRRWKR